MLLPRTLGRIRSTKKRCFSTIKLSDFNFSNNDEFSVKNCIKLDSNWVLTEEAKSTLHTFLTSSSNCPNHYYSNDIIDYIEKRLSNHQEFLNPSSIRVLSSLLTFPLTLSYFLHHVRYLTYDMWELGSKDKSNNLTERPFKILLLGARSESSLASIWWREALLAAFEKDGSFSRNMEILMLGPDLHLKESSIKNNMSHAITYQNKKLKPIQRKGSIKFLSSIDIQDERSNLASIDRFSHQPIDKSLFPAHPSSLELLRWADVFVLFNPGLGSSALQGQWDETIKLLFASKKPVFCTAHSDHDLHRDLDFLRVLSHEEDHEELGEKLEFIIDPKRNPYQSFRATIDEKEDPKARIVLANQHIYGFHSK